MKKILKAFVVVTFMLMIVTMSNVPVVQAEEYGNEWVYDEAKVITQTTEDYVKNLNETVFVNYKRKPQLAIIVIDKLPSNIDIYKQDMFNEYGVGTKEENCGMLFVFAIEGQLPATDWKQSEGACFGKLG